MSRGGRVVARATRREPRDPIGRLEARLRSPEFREVIRAYRERFGIPRQGYPKSEVDWQGVPWLTAAIRDKGALGEMARALGRICGWLDVGDKAIPVLAEHLWFNSPLPPQAFAHQFADPLRRPALERLAKDPEAYRPGSMAAVSRQWARRRLAWPHMRPWDLPLLLLVEDTADKSWAERAAIWNRRFRRRRVTRAETLARYWRDARQREDQRRYG